MKRFVLLLGITFLLISIKNLNAGEKAALIISLASTDTTEYVENFDEAPEIAGSIEDFIKRIQYPEAAKKAKTEGKVFVIVFIDEKGKVVDAKIEKSVTPELDAAAIKAVMETSFKPAKVNGKPVKAKVVLPVKFALK